jgi:hypothetical protein
MPLKLHVGLSKKVGLPNYGSLGASCHLEVELDAQLLARDRPEFEQQVQIAFDACSNAVQEELARQAHSPRRCPDDDLATESSHSNGPVDDHSNGSTNGASQAVTNGRSLIGEARSNRRQATSSQVRAIFAIANRHDVDLLQALQDRFGVEHASELSVSDASRFIDELQTLGAGTGGSA